ncbi:hypothetical protein CI102_12503 [Trichoderma harzianum]|uniref:Uncharacterized protein n=1 Tax=Trichoderma harzianum CBS 226.95 TaxID=983964 RepID=A0A2T4A3B1_TRIHA|nr:hypothetical protein M431DRAFT_121379 [Trichoderma harzianum CBS 226.95]PKK43899.1 hypothetical protein CI102_12503 [Trichoderma harzianum]PTB51528.1 hypothetical protein M431DRAFT_121379 [Trichoderma harzianum CBS 226.95]
MAALHHQIVPSVAHNPQAPDPSRPRLVSASALASIEKRRRDFVRSLGPCPSGCEDLDVYVLLGGFERGSVVGISAEDEDGVGLGLQVLVCSLLDKAVQKVQIVTPKPPSTIVVLLKNSITAELKARGITAPSEIAAQGKLCLDRILLSRVFDMDGLCEVLADLDNAVAPGAEEHVLHKPEGDDAQPTEGETAKTQAKADDVPRDLGDEPQSPNSTSATPDIILITHFSSLLTSFFTQRDNSVAHATLRLLASRLRRLSRTLSSNPLILLINSTDSGAASSTATTAATAAAAHSSEHDIPPPDQPATQKPSVDPTLRSIFKPSSEASGHGHAGGYKPNKPTFGLVFTQLLDVHLLCTRAPRLGKTSLPRALTVVEVLLDDIGLWEGKRGLRKRREQRWTVVAPYNGRIINASDGKKLIGKE